MRLDSTALEDAVVRVPVEPEAPLEPLRVAIEGVRVLHDELAHADQAAAWPRLVALLRLEVVPVLGQLLVAVDLPRVERKRLLVRQREHELAPEAVADVDDLRDRRSARRLPELDRREHGREPFLGTERVQLLPDDLLDLAVNPPTERREAPDPRGELPHEPAAHEQLVARCLRVGGVVAQGR